ncbi:MAG: protein phosphatase 2C domain-containing protein [Candidatus Margulisiibacteriota bacterium]
MPVKFDRIDRKFLAGVRTRTLAHATWRGPLLRIAERVLKPIATGQQAVSREIKLDALRLQAEINAAMRKLPLERPALVVKAKTPEKTGGEILGEPFVGEMIGGGAEGRVAEISAGNAASAGLTGNGGRSNNEDALLVARYSTADKDQFLLLVADGLGGHGDGEKASAAAAASFRAAFALAPDFRFVDGLNAAANNLATQKAEGLTDKQAATTVAAIQINATDNRAVVNSLGDSRAYLFRDGELYLLTRDGINLDNFYQAMKDQPGFAKDYPNIAALYAHLAGEGLGRFDALRAPFAPQLARLIDAASRDFRDSRSPLAGSLINNAVGASKPFVILPETALELKTGDLLILATDGAFEAVPSFDALAEIIRQNQGKAPAELADLINAAAQKQASDNQTIAIYRHGEVVLEVSESMEIHEPPAAPPAPVPVQKPVDLPPVREESWAPPPPQAAAADPLAQQIGALRSDLLQVAEPLLQQQTVARNTLEKQQRYLLGLQQERQLKLDNIELQVTLAREHAEQRIKHLKDAMTKAIDERRAKVIEELRGIWQEIDPEILAKRVSVIDQEDPEIISIRARYESKIAATTTEAADSIALLSNQSSPIWRVVGSLAAEIKEQEALVEAAHTVAGAIADKMHDYEAARGALTEISERLAKAAGLAGSIKDFLTALTPVPAAEEDAPTAVRNIPAKAAAEEDAPTTVMPITKWKDPDVIRILNTTITIAEKAKVLGILAGQGNKEAAAALLLPEFQV